MEVAEHEERDRRLAGDPLCLVPTHIRRHGYHLQPFEVSIAGLKLSGMAWVWDRLDPDDCIALAFGLLIGNALRTRSKT